MYINHNTLNDYPFFGQFFRMGIDEGKPLIEQTEEEILVFETKCDITEASHTRSNNFISAKFIVYFPFEEQVAVRVGDIFKADMYGLIVDGKVVGVFPSQLGGVTVYIQDTNA